MSSQSVAGPSRIRKRDKVANLTKKMFKKLPKVSLDISLIFPITNAGFFVYIPLQPYWTFYKIDIVVPLIFVSLNKFDCMIYIESFAIESL